MSLDASYFNMTNLSCKVALMAGGVHKVCDTVISLLIALKLVIRRVSRSYLLVPAFVVFRRPFYIEYIVATQAYNA